jgi:hypothetical protein
VKVLIISIFLFITSSKVFAGSLYGGLAYTYGVSTAKSDFWNGASGSAPLIILGGRFDKLAVEMQYRKYTLNNIHETTRGQYNIDISNPILSLGGRYYANAILHYNFGLAIHDISVEYQTNASASLSSKAIAGRTTSFYAGGGIHGPLFLNGLEWLVDLNYIHHSMEYGVFSFDIGVIYNFWSF